MIILCLDLYVIIIFPPPGGVRFLLFILIFIDNLLVHRLIIYKLDFVVRILTSPGGISISPSDYEFPPGGTSPVELVYRCLIINSPLGKFLLPLVELDYFCLNIYFPLVEFFPPPGGVRLPLSEYLFPPGGISSYPWWG